MPPARLALLLAVALTAPAGARAADIDPLVPADTQSYLAIQVRQLLDAPVVKKQLLRPAREFLDKELADLNRGLKEVGFDPFRDLDRVVIASPGGDDTDRGLIIAHGRFDPARIKAKAEAAARDKAASVQIHQAPLGKGLRHAIYEVALGGDDQSLFVAVLSHKTLVASPGKDYVVAALKQAASKQQAALKNKHLQALVENLDAKHTVSIAVLGKALGGGDRLDFLPRAARDALGSVDAIGGGLTVSTEVTLDLAVATQSEKHARTVRDTLNRGVTGAVAGLALLADENNKGLSLLFDVLQTVRVVGRGKVVGVSARLSADVLQEFFGKGK